MVQNGPANWSWRFRCMLHLCLYTTVTFEIIKTFQPWNVWSHSLRTTNQNKCLIKAGQRWCIRTSSALVTVCILCATMATLECSLGMYSSKPCNPFSPDTNNFIIAYNLNLGSLLCTVPDWFLWKNTICPFSINWFCDLRFCDHPGTTRAFSSIIWCIFPYFQTYMTGLNWSIFFLCSISPISLRSLKTDECRIDHVERSRLHSCKSCTTTEPKKHLTNLALFARNCFHISNTMPIFFVRTFFQNLTSNLENKEIYFHDISRAFIAKIRICG